MTTNCVVVGCRNRSRGASATLSMDEIDADRFAIFSLQQCPSQQVADVMARHSHDFTMRTSRAWWPWRGSSYGQRNEVDSCVGA